MLESKSSITLISAKIPVSIYDANYKTKCDKKECYVCGAAATKYIRLECQGGKTDEKHIQSCPVCAKGVPVNVPICDNPDCMKKFSKNWHVDHKKGVGVITNETGETP